MEVSYWGPGEFANVTCGSQVLAQRLPFSYARYDLDKHVLWVDGALAVDGGLSELKFDVVFHSYELTSYTPNYNALEEHDEFSGSEGEEESDDDDDE